MKQVKVLLVVSDTDVKKHIKDMLKTSGYMVYTAGDGASALRLAKSVAPDAAVIDEILHGINGIEVTDILAREYNTHAIIIMTAGTYKKASMRADKAVCLIKPVSDAMVLEALDTLLKHKNCQTEPDKKIRGLQRKINTAKMYLMEEEHYTEEEAHRYIQKQAMDFSINMDESAGDIIEKYKNSL